MARLRIRIELSRGGVGVPLRKLASVIVESQKFLNLLTEDVRVDQQRGEWIGFDFDSESLNFTAEYVGPVTTQQVEAFNAAFGGTTSLRRDTIGQFLRITDSIGEDEVIGFGLYESEGNQEPTDWRCLSRRDALRIADEVQVLLGAGEEPHLPSAGDRALGARIFGDRRDRHADQHLAQQVRAVESGLTTRIERLENQVEKHSGLIQDLSRQSTATESSVLGLLSTFETFCDQATRKIEQMGPRMIAAPAARIHWRQARKPWILTAAGLLVAALGIAVWYWASPPGVKAKQQPPAAILPENGKKSEPQMAQGIPASPAAPALALAGGEAGSITARNPERMNVELSATEPTWISMHANDGSLLLSQLMMPGSVRALSLTNKATLRAGNAGGLVVRLNGSSIGPLGPSGQVRNLEFNNGKARIIP